MVIDVAAPAEQKPWNRSPRFLIPIVIVFALAVAATVWVLAGNRDDAAPPADEPAAVEPALEGLDVAAEDFRAAYNEAIGELGAGEALRSPRWVHDESLGLDVAEQSIGDWGLLEMYRHPNESLAAYLIVARPPGPEDEASFMASAAAAISAAIGMAPGDARTILDADLRAAEPEARPLHERFEHGGAAFELRIVEGPEGSWQFTITSAAAEDGL